MRDHEVPTHVGAEDKALLFLTFPQVAAMLAVAGMGYGVWRFTPFGPSELRAGRGRGAHRRRGDDRTDWGKAAAAGRRRPPQVPADAQALRGGRIGAGAGRTARAGREASVAPDASSKRSKAQDDEAKAVQQSRRTRRRER